MGAVVDSIHAGAAPFRAAHVDTMPVIEQAKGILMARHVIDADRAFELLRDHSQHNGHKLVDVAQAIVDSHLLLLPPIPPPVPRDAT